MTAEEQGGAPNPTERPAVSVLIVTYQGMRYLKACLESFLDQDLAAPYEVIVIDNASSDGSAAYVEREFPSVRVIRLERNLGYGAANNIGAEAAVGEVIVVTNQDTVAHRRLLRAFVERLSGDVTVGACEPNLIHPWVPGYEGMAERATPPAFCFADLTSMGYVVYRQAEDGRIEADTSFVTGACFAIPRRVLDRLGYLFDPGFFMYGEDVDLSLRLHGLGLRTIALRGAVLFHSHHLDSTLSWRSFRKTVMIIRNRILAYRGTLSGPAFALKLPLLLAGGPMNAFAFDTPRSKALLHFGLLVPTTAVALVEVIATLAKRRSDSEADR